MGRGGGGRGGGGGGNFKGIPRFQFLTGFFGPSYGDLIFFGPSRVAIEKGLRYMNELLAVLGKKAYEISNKEALDILYMECSSDVSEQVSTLIYHPGKGYEKCNRLVQMYIEAKRPSLRSIRRENLIKYCGYTDEELRQLKVFWDQVMLQRRCLGE
ncbi:hypothetical protein RND81_04G142200 [Saponaria officinalis]|uniref:Uncharacterized protein n=1 Tax=Saponaria officinalis TaxID=3572 RepID=A0AAW1LLM3_SAPOF